MSKDLRNVDLNLLIVFNTLAEEQHLTKTAQKLHLSQPAVSNALSRLRDLFADELFVRAPKGMRPTLKAQSLKQPVKQALDIIQSQLYPPEVFDCATAKNHFSIAVNGYAEFVVLPTFLNGLRKLAPNIVLDIYSETDSETPEKLRSGELDITLDYIPIRGKDFIEETIFTEELVVVSAKNHPALSNGVDLKAYNSLPHVSMHPRTHKGSPTEILLGKKQINRNIAMSVTNMISLPALAAQTDLICTVPKQLAQHFEKSLKLDIHKLPFPIPPIPVQMIYHREKEHDTAHTWLRSQIRTMAKVTPPGL